MRRPISHPTRRLGRVRVGGVTPQRHPDHQLAARSSPPHLLDRLALDYLDPRLGEGLGAPVAAGDRPLVMLLAKDHATRRITDSRSGKMPTTSVRRRTSSFNLSCELLDQ